VYYVKISCLAVLLSVLAGCVSRPAGMPQGMVGAVGRDTNGDRRPDLWLLYRGRALNAAAADTGVDGKVDTAVTQEVSGISVRLDYDRNGAYDCNIYIQGMCIAGFQAASSPSQILSPFSERRPSSNLFRLSVDTRLNGSPDMEAISRPEWCHVRYDRSNNGKHDTSAVYEKGRLSRIEIDMDNDGNNDLWGVFDAGAPTTIKWLAAGKLYYWFADGDRFGVDDDVDGVVDRMFSVDAVNLEALDEISAAFAIIRRRLAER